MYIQLATYFEVKVGINKCGKSNVRTSNYCAVVLGNVSLKKCNLLEQEIFLFNNYCSLCFIPTLCLHDSEQTKDAGSRVLYKIHTKTLLRTLDCFLERVVSVLYWKYLSFFVSFDVVFYNVAVRLSL